MAIERDGQSTFQEKGKMMMMGVERDGEIDSRQTDRQSKGSRSSNRRKEGVLDPCRLLCFFSVSSCITQKERKKKKSCLVRLI